uniref:NADH-ubiquinone oxidoreductase chain 3 n=1 Tax=Scorpiops tibetanus TaxID=500600 RepID=A0A7M3UTV8_SCOTI|nr:NADH dehydrogenase subunit 3 [Scorpiops tibetanus]QOJ45414.1 NADH dehydrogenase subunit 3 [Scorpiops tibetanus]
MLFIFIFFMFLLGVLMMFLNLLLSKSVILDKESGSSFECGFDPSSSSRLSFSLQFFLIGIVFLIFDVEIALMLPVPFCDISLFYVFVLSSFVIVLLFGLYFEWIQGTLEWMK